MAREIIVGTGRQKSLLKIVSLLEKQVARTQGLPGKVSARGKLLEVTAERKDLGQDFDRFLCRADVDGEMAAAVEAVAAKYAGVCRATREDRRLVIACPPPDVEPDGRCREAMDAVAALLPLPEVWRVQGGGYRVDPVSVELLFQAMVQYKASDVHLAAGQRPVFRVDGDTCTSELLGALSSVQIMDFIRELAGDQYWLEFERNHQTSFNYHQLGMGYSRVSAFMKGGAPHCTMRFLPEAIPSFEDLGIPRDAMERLGAMHHGLVLITGMTGSGKTTTAAALLDYINSTQLVHILAIENPIEYVIINKKSVVSQRSLGEDVETFNMAVTGALRHDPDVMFIGEMRDPDTIRSAINAAATGHLVVSTLHSNTASEVINRVVSFFDPVERDLVKLQLRDCIRCIICQRLVPKIGGGRLPALEFLFNDIKPINDAILAGDTDAIRIGMQQKVSHSFIFEEYLMRLYRAGRITLEHAQQFSTDQSILDQMHMGTYSVPRLEGLKAAAAREARS